MDSATVGFTPKPGGGYSISGCGAADIFSFAHQSVFHRDVTAWSQMAFPEKSASGLTGHIQSGLCMGSGTLLVSSYSGFGVPQFVHRYDGSQWTDEPAPGAFRAMAAMAAERTRPFAVGVQGAIWRRSGTQWDSVRSGTDSDLLALAACDNGDMLAVGAHATILRRRPD